MARVARDQIDVAFDQLIRLAERGGADTDDWQLCEGDAEADPRTPWTLCDENRRLITLGYTRRAALSALTSMNAILTVVQSV